MKEKGHYRSIIGCCLEDGFFHFTSFRFLTNEMICKAYISRVHLAKIHFGNQSLNAVLVRTYRKYIKSRGPCSLCTGPETHFNTLKKDNSLSKSIDEQILLIHLCTLVRPTHHLN